MAEKYFLPPHIYIISWPFTTRPTDKPNFIPIVYSFASFPSNWTWCLCL